jgi:transcriptional regulator with XRE-family HTH domain
MDTLIANIEQMRASRGETIAGLARRCGLTRSQMSLLLHGKHEPTVGLVARIAAGLEVEVQDLFATRADSAAA